MQRDSVNSRSEETGPYRELFQSDSPEDFTAAAMQEAGRILTSLHVEEDRFEEILGSIEADASYGTLKDSWENLNPEERIEHWHSLLENMVRTAYAARPYCMRCGECCSRVSPSLHPGDIDLFNEGILRYRDVYTLRKGEPVLDNVHGSLDTLARELVKVGETPDTRQCRLYLESEKTCSIYDRRPVQCRTQECWNPDGLEQLWNREKLTREDLLKNDAELLDVIGIHEERCSAEGLDRAIKNYWETGDAAALDPVVDMLSQDVIIRKFFIEKMGRDAEELDFLLGRPLARVVESYNLKVEQDADGTYRLTQNE